MRLRLSRSPLRAARSPPLRARSRRRSRRPRPAQPLPADRPSSLQPSRSIASSPSSATSSSRSRICSERLIAKQQEGDAAPDGQRRASTPSLVSVVNELVDEELMLQKGEGAQDRSPRRRREQHRRQAVQGRSAAASAATPSSSASSPRPATARRRSSSASVADGMQAQRDDHAHDEEAARGRQDRRRPTSPTPRCRRRSSATRRRCRSARRASRGARSSSRPSRRRRQGVARARRRSRCSPRSRRGGDFEQIAKRESADSGQPSDNGGDLGWNRRGKMVPEFDRWLFGYYARAGPAQPRRRDAVRLSTSSASIASTRPR